MYCVTATLTFTSPNPQANRPPMVMQTKTRTITQANAQTQALIRHNRLFVTAHEGGELRADNQATGLKLHLVISLSDDGQGAHSKPGTLSLLA